MCEHVQCIHAASHACWALSICMLRCPCAPAYQVEVAHHTPCTHMHHPRDVAGWLAGSELRALRLSIPDVMCVLCCFSNLQAVSINV